MESDKVVLDGGYVDLDPAKLASISTTAPASSVSDPLTLCNSDQVWFLKNYGVCQGHWKHFSNPLSLVVVQATCQFGVAHFLQIGNLGRFVEMFFADEGFPLVYVGNVLRQSSVKCENVQCASSIFVPYGCYVKCSSSIYAAVFITIRQGSQVDSNL